MKRIFNAIVGEIAAIYAWYLFFFVEEPRAHAEWYRQEIIKAFEDKDYQRAQFLMQEEGRGG